jgi:hypothetical protein
MKDPFTLEDQNILLSIQNSKKPEQLIYLVLDDSREHLETQGLQNFFGVKEIRLDTKDVLDSLEEYAAVLSFILESISTAGNLGLPYSYQNEFEFGGARYSLYDAGEHRILKKLEAASR